MSQITTHVLDITRGCPGAGIFVTLYQEVDDLWKAVANSTTTNEGKILDLLKTDFVLIQGCYRLRFNTQDYFKSLLERSFYPYIDVVFNVYDSDEHYHIPLLISAHGFTTYRGS
jgi:5-hydroxyisourate hydrolase